MNTFIMLTCKPFVGGGDGGLDDSGTEGGAEGEDGTVASVLCLACWIVVFSFLLLPFYMQMHCNSFMNKHVLHLFAVYEFDL